MDVDELTEVFRKLGADDPEGWARSQVEEGIPQLHRFVFLREAWTRVLGEDESEWIDSEIRASKEGPAAPFSGVGAALGRLRAAGADDRDVTDVVRGMQVSLLFSLAYLLEDPGGIAERLGIAWALVKVDPETVPANEISGLHESVLGTDPTGREMRPRNS